MDPALNSLLAGATTTLFITLGISVPIIAVLLIRFLWDRHVSVGRSRELDKLVWQLHRIASALEQQNSRAIPVEFVADAAPATHAPVTPASAPAAAAATPLSAPQAPAAPAPAAAQAQTPPAAPRPAPQPAAAHGQPAAVPAPQHQKAGVNSMFGF
jgi:hypothetical protein